MQSTDFGILSWSFFSQVTTAAFQFFIGFLPTRQPFEV
jgi:hypothetical protein